VRRKREGASAANEVRVSARECGASAERRRQTRHATRRDGATSSLQARKIRPPFAAYLLQDRAGRAGSSCLKILTPR
jgi:hypothetical protein